MTSSIVLITHGRLGEGLLDSAAMICGDVEVARSISYAVGTSPEELDATVETLLDDPDVTVPVLFLTDLPGGTPSRIAATHAAHGRGEAVTGVNLPMVIEAIQAARRKSPEELCALVVERGRAGVVDIGAQIRAALAEEGQV